MPARTTGFTLLEVMVALMLLSLLAITSYRALGSVLDADAHTRAELAFWQQLSATWMRVEDDLQAAVPVSSSPYLQGSFFSNRTQSGTASFSLVRQLPESAGGALQQVTYAFADGSLSRSVARPDVPQGDTHPVVLLPGIEKLEFRYMDGTGRWQLDALVSATALPRAVEMVMTWPDGRSVRRVFRVQ